MSEEIFIKSCLRRKINVNITDILQNSIGDLRTYVRVLVWLWGSLYRVSVFEHVRRQFGSSTNDVLQGITLTNKGVLTNSSGIHHIRSTRIEVCQKRSEDHPASRAYRMSSAYQKCDMLPCSNEESTDKTRMRREGPARRSKSRTCFTELVSHHWRSTS
ncbi:hypothetical protein GJ744_001631 [Endocarpon pusillum]|uniref:Uncharacterized protein n=1 Tax=Endocarpon pusillum TaxID=364733 RepID=A0A8H7E127_9EURO|nr:hypothetical protein GJ744_001631 [Endocarpon pusillum]